MKFNTLAFAALLLGACGIADDTLLTDIDADLWSKVCSKVAEEQPATDAIACDGYEIPATEGMTKDEHEAACNDSWGDTSTWTDCTATFGDWVDYQEYESPDPCVVDENIPAAVTAVGTCFMNNM